MPEFDTWSQLQRQFGSVADFLMVYIDEAHAADEWYLPALPVKVPKAKSVADRAAAAQAMAQVYGRAGPGDALVVDGIADDFAHQYSAMPEKFLVIENGVVQFASGQGPVDYKPADLHAWLAKRYPQCVATAAGAAK